MLPFCDRVVSVPRDKYLPSRIRGVPVQKDFNSLGGHLRRRRLQLKIFQSEAAHRMKVSNRTLSLWECDRLYPTWFYWPRICAYLGFDIFTDSTLGRPKGNESSSVAFLSSGTPMTTGQKIIKQRMEMRKTRTQYAEELGISYKTLWNWEHDRRKPCRSQLKKLNQSGLMTAS
jgi:DNA-binding XRE family transcriptional regulator